MNDGCKSRWPEPEPQSALVVVVPDAEFLVEVVRSAHDPAAAAGIPPHITVLYPFLPPKQLDAAGNRQEVASCFQQFVPFDFVLVSVKRFLHPLRRTRAKWIISGAYLEGVGDVSRVSALQGKTFPYYPSPYSGLERRRRNIDPGCRRVRDQRSTVPTPSRQGRGGCLADQRFGPWQAVATFPFGRGGACSEAEVRPFSERLRGEL